MQLIAPSEKDITTVTQEKRLWDAADQFRAMSGLKAQEYSAPVLGLIFLRFAEVRFAAHRAGLEKVATTSRRGSWLDEPAAYHAEGILYLPDEARFDFRLNRPEDENFGAKVNAAMRDIEKHNLQLAGVLPKTYILQSELLQNSQRRIRLWDAMARALYREWFVRFCFPGHEMLPRVASPLGDIPQGWEVRPVKDNLARRAAGTVYCDEDAKPEGAIPILDQSTNELLGFHDNEPDHLACPTMPMAIFGDHTCKMQLLIEPSSVGPNVVLLAAGRELPTAYVFFAVNSLVQTQEYKRHWIPLNAKEVIVAEPGAGAAFPLTDSADARQAGGPKKSHSQSPPDARPAAAASAVGAGQPQGKLTHGPNR